jgi:hypothetical protein
LILEREYHDAERPPVRAPAQLRQGWRRGRKDVILGGFDLGERRKATQFFPLAIGYDRRRRQRMIEQAAVGAARLYGACPGEGKIAEAREASIDPGKRLGQFRRKVARRDVKLAPGCVEQELAPAERS